MDRNQATFSNLLVLIFAFVPACDDAGGGEDTTQGSSTTGAVEPTATAGLSDTTQGPTGGSTTGAGETGGGAETSPATTSGAQDTGEAESGDAGSSSEGGETDDVVRDGPRVHIATLQGDTFTLTDSLPVTGGPADIDWSRWGLLNDDAYDRLYFLPTDGPDAVYQFALNTSTGAFEYGYESLETIDIVGTPAEADPGAGFGMAYGGFTYALYMLDATHQTAFGFGFESGLQIYEHGYDVPETLTIDGAPDGIDWSGWATAANGSTTSLYAFASEAHDALVHFERSGNTFSPLDTTLSLDPTGLEDVFFDDFAVVHDGDVTRLYIVDVD